MSAAQSTPPAADLGHARTVAWTSTTYFAEGLPWSVLHQIASEFLTAAGLPPSQVGYTSALHLTSTLKFLWSPVVDLYGSFRQWIFATQAVLGALIGMLAVLAEDLSRSAGQDTSMIWLTLIAIGVASATHDIACDGYYMDALPRAAQARYAGMRVAAFRVAMLVGNSGLVYLGGRHSWLLGFGVAAALMLALAVGHRLLLPRGANERARASAVQARSGAERMAHIREAYLSFLRQDRALLVVLFLLTYKLGDALMFNMSKVLLRDLGVSTAERGVINGFGTAASIIGAMIGGAWIARTSLARAIVPITILMTATQPLYLLLAAPALPMSMGQLADAPAFFLGGLAPSLTTVGLIMVIEQLCGGMAVAAQMVFLMRRCHPDHKAAHFAFGTAIYALSQMATGAYSGWVYQAQGPLVYFALACVACIPCLLLVGLIADSEPAERTSAP
ncbi:MAG: MFS transporter [Nannocystis sp.]|nr:MFS transporter [Nannocystis sp.]MBA3549361.1 MFS transporter [Nannocystis sp.]